MHLSALVPSGIIASVAVLAAVPSPAQTCPVANCQDDASTYLVRSNCTGLQNCFTRLEDLVGTWAGASALPVDPPPATCSGCQTGWLWTKSPAPSESAPVRIEIGPGVWAPFICPSAAPGSATPFGHVTVVGAGSGATTLRADVIPGGDIGIDVSSCEDLAFENLRAEGAFYGVRWADGGSSYWRNVDIVGIGPSAQTFKTGWIDQCTTAALLPGPARHLLSNVNVSVVGPTNLVFGWASTCAHTTWSGGSITVALDTATNYGEGIHIANQTTGEVVPSTTLIGVDIDVSTVAPVIGNNTIGAIVAQGALLELFDLSVGVHAAVGNVIGVRNDGGNVEVNFVDFDLGAPGTQTEVLE